MSYWAWSFAVIIMAVFIGVSYYLRGIREERDRILDIIQKTWANRRQTTDKITFMMNFKDELQRRIKE